MDKSGRKSVLILFLTALIWGMGFVSQSKGMEFIRPFTFTASRNLLAALFLLPMVVYRVKKQDISLRYNLKGGIICGLALVAADLCQQYGIAETTVAKAGFITTLYIIFTPIMGIPMGKRVGMRVWGCAALAVLGMYLISITGDFTIGRGDLLVLICALLFAVHIMVIDVYGAGTDGIVLSFIQFGVCFVVCSLLALVVDKPTGSQLYGALPPILYAGLISSGVGYTLQTIGQRGCSPTVAALILSLESVIAAVAGYAAYRLGILNNDQSLTARQIIGCIVVFAAVIIVQLPEKNNVKERKIACD